MRHLNLLLAALWPKGTNQHIVETGVVDRNNDGSIGSGSAVFPCEQEMVQIQLSGVSE